MDRWLRDQIEKKGLFKVLAFIWVMVLFSVVVLWALADPGILKDEVAYVLVPAIVGIVGTVITVIKS